MRIRFAKVTSRPMFTLLRSFVRCRRGATAVIFAIAAIPLIGVVGLGTEAGIWYKVKQGAQNAADSAAYSGALGLAGSATSAVVVSQAKEFAAQNSFCNSGDTSYAGSRCVTPPAGTTQNVAISIGSYAAPVFTASTAVPPVGSAVQAVVSQTQPPLLSSLFLTGNITASARAIAIVKTRANPCVLALAGSISFQGSATVTTPGCGLASNSTASNAIDFTGGGGMNLANVGSLSAAGGCSGAASLCGSALTYAPPVVNPLAALDPYLSGLTIATKCTGSGPVAYTAATPCVNDKFTFAANTTYTLSGTYFFSGAVKIPSNTTISGTATIILLTGASLTITGNPQINLTAQATVPTSELPASLQPSASLLGGLLLYDSESSTVNIGGNSTSAFNGVMYLPNANVNYQGNPGATSCSEVIAYSVQLAGNPNFNNTGCPASATPVSQIVQLVQ